MAAAYVSEDQSPDGSKRDDPAPTAKDYKSALFAAIRPIQVQGSENIEQFCLANVERFLGFRGTRDDEWLEMQVLDARGPNPNYPRTYFTHIDSCVNVLAALQEAESRLLGMGAFYIMNAVNPAVRARADANSWNVTPKGGGTTDNDIVARRVMYFDFDPKGPKGISADGGECQRGFDVAVGFYAQLAVDLGPAHRALGFGFSGNGSQVHLALRDVQVNDATTSLIKGLLAAAACLFATEDVDVDRSVSDPKRLCPAFGTTKRKGADNPERPHRRSWFWCHDDVYRLTQAELEALLAAWRGRITSDQRAEVDRAMGMKATPVAHTAKPAASPPRTASGPSTPFTEANAIPIQGVSEWLGMMQDGYPVCPGCGTTGDTSVAFVGNGLKCLHARCVDKGTPGRPGFRTVVDLVAEAKGVTSIEAVKLVAAQFGTAPPRTAAHARDETDIDWEEPIPLEIEPALPLFPSWALPPTLREYVVALAVATQTPIDLGGMLILAILSLCLGRKFVACVKAGWTEALSLYCVVSLPPASRKFAAFAAATRPVAEYEFGLIEAAYDRIAQAQAERLHLELKLKQAGVDAKKDASKLQTVSALMAQLSRLVVPISPRLLVDDVTPESLGQRMAEQPYCLGIFSPEGGVFDLLAGLYSDGVPNIDLVLKGHDGEHARVDRVNRGSLSIPHATLAIGLTVQPHVIEQLSKKPAFRGRGLLARLLMVAPANTVGKRDPDPPTIPPQVAAAYGALVDTLLQIPVPTRNGRIEPELIEFDDEARDHIRHIAAQLEPDLGEDGALYEIGDWAGKLVGTIARIATLLHLAEYPHDRAVHFEAVDRANEIGKYLLAHAKHAFALMSASIEATRASKVLAWITRKGVTHFTRREAFEGAKGTCITKIADLDQGLAVLVQNGLIRQVKDAARTGPGRPRGPTFEVNPLALAVVHQGTGDPGDATAAPHGVHR